MPERASIPFTITGVQNIMSALSSHAMCNHTTTYISFTMMIHHIHKCQAPARDPGQSHSLMLHSCLLFRNANRLMSSELMSSMTEIAVVLRSKHHFPCIE
jgi:hypothetical protein